MNRLKHSAVFLFLLLATSLTWLRASGIEQATPAIKRFVSPNGFEVSFPNTWRTVNREGFELFIDQLGGPGEAATLSFSAVNVAPRAREAIAADLATDAPQAIAGTVELLKRRFPDVKIIRSGRTVLGNFSAIELLSTYSIRNPESKMEVLGWLILAYKDGKLVRVQFEATGPRHNEWQRDAATVLSTFMYL